MKQCIFWLLYLKVCFVKHILWPYFTVYNLMAKFSNFQWKTQSLTNTQPLSFLGLQLTQHSSKLAYSDFSSVFALFWLIKILILLNGNEGQCSAKQKTRLVTKERPDQEKDIYHDLETHSHGFASWMSACQVCLEDKER